jgi:hypothetical protein
MKIKVMLGRPSKTVIIFAHGLRWVCHTLNTKIGKGTDTDSQNGTDDGVSSSPDTIDREAKTTSGTVSVPSNVFIISPASDFI